LDIVWAIRKLRHYLEGYHLKVVANHMALKWLNSIESPPERIALEGSRAARKGLLRQPMP